MATRSWLLTVSVLVEQDAELAAKLGPGWRTDDDLQEVVTAALSEFLAKRPDIVVEWQSMTSTPLDGKPAVGRCAVCNCWVYDVENRTDGTPTKINRGAVVDGQYLCDEHLPKDHPVAF
ncbi:MAG: hypothetical protein K8U57_17005 [Planctomycetes bacterium]|nr:hypothetical protein [Planctomycetota bacterium]